MDNLSPEQRHKNMQNIRSKNTSIELILRKELRKRHIGYRIHYKDLPGKPDIVLTKHKIVIFCDSEFFHGKNFDELKERLKNSNNSEYWITKIRKNVDRDVDIDKQLHTLGWTVLHFWGQDIIKHPDQCIQVIKETIFNKKMGDIEYI